MIEMFARKLWADLILQGGVPWNRNTKEASVRSFLLTSNGGSMEDHIEGRHDNQICKEDITGHFEITFRMLGIQFEDSLSYQLKLKSLVVCQGDHGIFIYSIVVKAEKNDCVISLPGLHGMVKYGRSSSSPREEQSDRDPADVEHIESISLFVDIKTVADAFVFLWRRR